MTVPNSVVSDNSNCFHGVQRVNNAMVTLYRDVNGVAAIYACTWGFKFAEGGVVRSTVCVNNKWIIAMADCEGLNHSYTTFAMRYGGP